MRNNRVWGIPSSRKKLSKNKNDKAISCLTREWCDFYQKEKKYFLCSLLLIPWTREWLPTPVFLPGEFYGQRSLVGYSPWDCRVRHDCATDPFTFYLWCWGSDKKQTTEVVRPMPALKDMITREVVNGSHLEEQTRSKYDPGRNDYVYSSLLYLWKSKTWLVAEEELVTLPYKGKNLGTDGGNLRGETLQAELEANCKEHGGMLIEVCYGAVCTMGRKVASKKPWCLKFSFVCKATMWPVFAGLSKSARHTDLCMKLGELRGKGLFYSSGSSWQKGRRVAAHDAQGSQESSGYRNLKTELTAI